MMKSTRFFPITMMSIGFGSLGALLLLAAENVPQSRPADDDTRDAARSPLTGPRGRRPNADRPGTRARAGRAGRGPSADRRGEGPGPADAPLTQEQTDRLMAFLERNFPSMHQRLKAVREKDPVLFNRMITRTGRLMLPMVRAAMEDPALANTMIREHKLQMRLQELKTRYSRVRDPAEKEQIRLKMRDELDRIFETRLERIRIEIGRLQHRLDVARQELGTQEKSKDRLIDQRLSHMLSDTPPKP